MEKIRVALLHLLPIAGDIPYNQGLVEKAIEQAKHKQVDWIITPELIVSGLQFANKVGTDWIEQQPDTWLTKLCSLARSANANVFIGCPEKGAEDHLYNSVFVIDRKGNLVGKQQKISSVTDQWSSSGTVVEAITLDNIKVGLMICADAYTKEVAETLLNKGVDIIVAPCSWGPGLHGPKGEWEQRSKDTGLPVFVCNRTGEDENVSFWEAESIVIKDGKRLLSYKSAQSSILYFDWDLQGMDVISKAFEAEYIELV